MSQRWSVQDAKAHLSKLLKRARAGQPQHIGITDGCVLVSESAWGEREGASFGEWLVATAPRGEPLKVASRRSRRGDPFEPAGRRRRK